MREYIFYSILIFLPIGYIVSLLLSREGLIKKHIIIFVAAAIIMIIIFPISAVRIGILSTALIYVSLLLIIAGYFIKTNQLDYLYKLEANALSQEISVETEFNLPGNSATDMISSNGITEKDTENITTEVYANVADHIPINGNAESYPTETQTAKNTEIKEELTADKLIPQDISAVPRKELENTPNSKESTAEQSENLIGDKRQEIINLIDKAFSVKSSDLREAINCFQAAMDIAENDELMYLLTMELFEDYKNIGAYGKAVTVLSDFINSNAAAPDKIDQMESNLIYLQIMINELEKLGTPDLPFSKIPRWIRLKVAENIKFLNN